MRIPKLTYHKSVARWCVWIKAKRVYLSKRMDVRTSRPPGHVVEAYNQIIHRVVEVRTTRPKHRPVSVLPTIVEVIAEYLDHAERYYVKHGRPTSEIHSIRAAMRPLTELCGDERADRFTPRKLQDVQAAMVAKGWARKTVNGHLHRVRAMFRWGVSQDLVPEPIWRALLAVRGLSKGRTSAPESKSVRCVGLDVIEATLAHAPEPLPDMVRAHRLIGCRAGEIVAMRPREIARSGKLWLWRPEIFKTEHLQDGDDEAGLEYWLGPQVQAIIGPRLDSCPSKSAWVFPVSYRRLDSRRRGNYDTNSYRKAILEVIDKANAAGAKVPHWTPLQIRHTRLTEVRRLAGLEAAQAVAQHGEVSTTQIYAERREDLAKKVMRKWG